jgi:hypothetical protein
MSLALRIDANERKASKVVKDNAWFQAQAEAMDIELDEDLLETATRGARQVRGRESTDDDAAGSGELRRLRAELAHLLVQPLYKQRAARFVAAQEGGMLDSGRLIAVAPTDAIVVAAAVPVNTKPTTPKPPKQRKPHLNNKKKDRSQPAAAAISAPEEDED